MSQSNAAPPASLPAPSATGAQAIAQAIVDAGCNFLSAGPTPAPRLLLDLLSTPLVEQGGRYIAARETRSALSLASGAALSGEESVTLMSSAGLRLCAEDIDLALRREIALVLVSVQERVQGDIQFIRWASVGGYPIIALVPDSVQACYDLTRRAFQLAWHFCMPIFLLTDEPTLALRASFENREPRPLLFALNNYTRDSSRIPYSPQVAHKLDPYREGLEWVLLDEAEGQSADTLVVAFGGTVPVAREGVNMARTQGRQVSLLVVHSLWPVPKRAIHSAVHDAQRVLVVELNFGQYRRELERMLGPHGPEVVGIHSMDGAMIEPERIASACL